MLGIVIALVVIVFVVSFRWRKKNISVFSDFGIPGPEPSLLFGNLIELYKKGPLKCHEEWVAKYGRVFGYYYGMTPILLVADPQKLKTIYIKDFSKFVDRVPANQLLDLDSSEPNLHSVINLRGQKWKEVRSVLTPTFSTAKMKKMAVTMNDSIDTMIDIMQRKAKSSEVFNILDLFQKLTIDVITRVAFGVVSDVQTSPNPRMLDAAKAFFSNTYRDVLVFIGLSFPSLKWLMRKTQSAHRAVLNKGINPISMLSKGLMRVMELRRLKPETRKPDLLQVMMDTKINVINDREIDDKNLEAGKDDDKEEIEKVHKATRNMTTDEILFSAITVLLAGFETTSTTLAFTSYLLSKHPEIQDKIFEEIVDLLRSGEKLEYGSVNKLPYLDKVLSESLRLYPPVTLFVNRIASEDVNYADLKIPKNMVVQAPVYLMHHDPEFWQDPETFQPERFDVKPNSDGITYLPFGIGPRNCMGMRFAQMETKLALAHMIYNFRLEPSPSLKDKLVLKIRLQTIVPQGGVHVKLHPREHETAL